MTDIVILGKNGFLNVVSLNEDVHSCLVELLSAVFVVEVDVNNKKNPRKMSRLMQQHV